MAEKELSDEAIVIRGGQCVREHMEGQANDEFELRGVHALSAGADNNLALHELAMANERPNPKIRKSTVGRLRAAGFRVTPPKGRKRHVDLILPSPPSDTHWEALEMAFDPPEPNPYYNSSQGGAT